MTRTPHGTDAHPDAIKVFHDPCEGAAYLRWKRSRKAAA